MVDGTERAAVLDVLAADPLVTCQAAERLAAGGTGAAGPGDTAGRFYTCGGPATSLFFVSGTVQPLRASPEHARPLVRALVTSGIGPLSVHGRRELVVGLWPALSAAWGPAREVRDRQQLLAPGPPVAPVAPEPGVRRMTPADFDALLPAAVAMYREELGSDPLGPGLGVPFRHRVARSVARGRSWGLVRDGRVVFKADVAAESARVAQLQGVWVAPEERGAGLGTRCMAAVLAALTRRGLTPTLVVNETNEAAMRLYTRLGMVPAADYATVLVV